jgi:prepilin-type N-terminal cleavage/methylation domain-containing protein
MTKKMPFKQRGFTVIELLVATVVFGIILLVVTVAILQFSRVYYKGITESNTQETARSIVDRIAQSIQFNGGVVTVTPPRPPGAGSPASPQAFCVGNQQYTYVVGLQLTDNAPLAGQNQNWHALVVRDLAGCTATSPTPSMNTAATTGQELLSPGMRLSKMKVESLGGNLYKVSVRIVTGPKDTIVGDTAVTARCETFQSGTQFCAVSDISTVIVKRVE